MSQASCAAGGGTGDGRAETHSPARHRKLAVDQGQSGRILASGVIRRVISHHAPTRDCGTSVDGSYLVGRIRVCCVMNSPPAHSWGSATPECNLTLPDGGLEFRPHTSLSSWAAMLREPHAAAACEGTSADRVQAGHGRGFFRWKEAWARGLRPL
ncbi:hypothetical protein CB1_000092007 [Camelus ferus]|nr:hypothetical protein CB1_000092007 [Camelus ferus]